MKTVSKMDKSIFQYLTTLALAILILTNGCKDKLVGTDIPKTGEISGTITINIMTGDKYPLAGISVYLIDANFKSDTVNHKNNKAAIVDSTVTDSSGKYIFEKIIEGNYNIVPMPGSNDYRFSLASESDPYSVSINDEQQSYSVNFTTYDLGMADVERPTLRFISKNLSSMDSLDGLHININRTEWWVFIPNTFSWNSYQSYSYNFNQPIEFCPQYGWTCGFYTLSNNFVFDFAIDDYQGDRKYIFNSKTFSYSIDFGLSTCPSLAVFEVDWKDGKVTRTQ